MKRLLCIVPILIIVSCGQKGSSSQKPTIIDRLDIKNNDTIRTSEPAEALEKILVVDTLKNFEIFRDFAIDFSPTRNPNSGVAVLPAPSDMVLSAVETIKFSQSKEYEKYLVLIFVKLYSAHLECCHQSYEIRRQPSIGLDRKKDPLVYEFNDLTSQFSNKKRIEFISSSIAYDYVNSHNYLLDFEPIKKHIEIIEQVHKNIEDGVYWK